MNSTGTARLNFPTTFEKEETEWKKINDTHKRYLKKEESTEAQKQALTERRAAHTKSHPPPDECFLPPRFLEGLRLAQKSSYDTEVIQARIDAAPTKVYEILEAKRRFIDSSLKMRFASVLGPDAQEQNTERNIPHTLLCALAAVDMERRPEMVGDAVRAARKDLQRMTKFAECHARCCRV
ncbi:hypothetical protein C8R44DRAFT_184325 [Mycena epipterygia]|nr:hypothetical protein C8R44DRAFT_184325 [Mycena epipterygia]